VAEKQYKNGDKVRVSNKENELDVTYKAFNSVYKPLGYRMADETGIPVNDDADAERADVTADNQPEQVEVKKETKKKKK